MRANPPWHTIAMEEERRQVDGDLKRQGRLEPTREIHLTRDGDRQRPGRRPADPPRQAGENEREAEEVKGQRRDPEGRHRRDVRGERRRHPQHQAGRHEGEGGPPNFCRMPTGAGGPSGPREAGEIRLGDERRQDRQPQAAVMTTRST